MNVLVHLANCTAINGGIFASIHICCSTGQEFGADIQINFANSSTQMNSAILARAQAVLVEQGVAGAAGATYKLFGGAA
jgi:hypothetical protein